MAPVSVPCTALELYRPHEFVTMRAVSIGVRGHHFVRAAGWLCRCGMRSPKGQLPSEIHECTALPD